VDVDSCGLISPKANQIFQTIKKLCFDSGLPVYDQKTHQGFFRHLVIREGVNTGQLMVNLSVCLANLSDEQTKVWEELLEKFKVSKILSQSCETDLFLKEVVTTFVITYNEGLADTVKNEKSETKVFWGDGYIHEILNFDIPPLTKYGSGDEMTEHSETDFSEGGKVTFRISPFSFFQTNTL
jgi:23S rRNA (uracil1939-C5)-methyltransferase